MVRRAFTEDDILRLVRQAVKAAGNQQKLADKLGVSPAYLSDILNGRRRPSEPFLSKFGYRRAYMVAE